REIVDYSPPGPNVEFRQFRAGSWGNVPAAGGWDFEKGAILYRKVVLGAYNVNYAGRQCPGGTTCTDTYTYASGVVRRYYEGPRGAMIFEAKGGETSCHPTNSGYTVGVVSPGDMNAPPPPGASPRLMLSYVVEACFPGNTSGLTGGVPDSSISTQYWSTDGQ